MHIHGGCHQVCLRRHERQGILPDHKRIKWHRPHKSAQILHGGNHRGLPRRLICQQNSHTRNEHPRPCDITLDTKLQPRPFHRRVECQDRVCLLRGQVAMFMAANGKGGGVGVIDGRVAVGDCDEEARIAIGRRGLVRHGKGKVARGDLRLCSDNKDNRPRTILNLQGQGVRRIGRFKRDNSIPPSHPHRAILVRKGIRNRHKGLRDIDRESLRRRIHHLVPRLVGIQQEQLIPRPRGHLCIIRQRPHHPLKIILIRAPIQLHRQPRPDLRKVERCLRHIHRGSPLNCIWPPQLQLLLQCGGQEGDRPFLRRLPQPEGRPAGGDIRLCAS